MWPRRGIRVDINAEVTDDSGWRDFVSANSKGSCGSWWECRSVSDHRISDLAVFNWSLLDRIQLATSSTQLAIVYCSSSDADSSQKPYVCVSSAYRCGLRPWPSISKMRSAVYSRKRINAGDEADDPVCTYWCRPTRYVLNHCSTIPDSPCEVFSHRIKMWWWSAMLKAADKSSNTSADKLPASMVSRMSDRTFNTAVSVEWFCVLSIYNRRWLKSATTYYHIMLQCCNSFVMR